MSTRKGKYSDIPNYVHTTDKKYFFFDEKGKPVQGKHKPKPAASYEVRNHFHAGSYAMARNGAAATLEHPYNAPKREAPKPVQRKKRQEKVTTPLVIMENHSYKLLLHPQSMEQDCYRFEEITPARTRKSGAYATRARAMQAYKTQRIVWLRED